MRLVDMVGPPRTVVLAPGASTFSIVGAKGIIVDGDPGANTVTSLSGGVAGDWFLLLFVDASVTITTAAMKLLGNVSFVSAANAVMLCYFDGTTYFEVTRTMQAGIDANTPIVANVTGNLTGNVTGNLTGNVTGNVTGNITGNVTGNVAGNVTEPIVALIATVDGATTGVIPTGTRRSEITSTVNTKLVTLPAPVVGDKGRLFCAANGYKLQSSDKATIKINNVADGAKVLAVAAGDLLFYECVTLTDFYIWKLNNLGAPATAGVPA